MQQADVHRITSFPNLLSSPQATPDPSAQTSRSPHKACLPSVSVLLCLLSLPGITSQTATAVPSIPRQERERRPAAGSPPRLRPQPAPEALTRDASLPARACVRPAHRATAPAHLAPPPLPDSQRHGLPGAGDPGAVGTTAAGGRPGGWTGARAAGLARTCGRGARPEAGRNAARPRRLLPPRNRLSHGPAEAQPSALFKTLRFRPPSAGRSGWCGDLKPVLDPKQAHVLRGLPSVFQANLWFPV